MRTMAALAALVFLLAGCGDSGGKADNYTCLDGTVVDLSQVPGSDFEGFDAERDACPKNLPPGLAITAMTPSFEAYRKGSVSWSLTPGTSPGGHSMESVVRFSHHPITEDQMRKITNINTYGIVEMGRSDHQNLPAEFTSSYSYTTPGKYYVRALARIYDNTHNETIYWTPEQVVEVTAVKPTGQSTTITHKLGNFLGGVDSTDVAVKLGDAVIFKNDDLAAHSFKFTSLPKNATQPDITVDSMGSSPPAALLVPGAYVVVTDDVQPVTITITVKNL